MTITLTGTAFDSTPAFGDVALGTVGAIDGTPDEPYTVLVVDKFGMPEGADAGVRALAEPVSVVDTLNAPQAFSIRFPKHKYAPADIPILGTPGSGWQEIQARLGTKVIAWGAAYNPSSAQSSTEEVVLNCMGAEWPLLYKRCLDAPEDNLLPNLGTGLTGWSTHDVSGGLTASSETDNILVGPDAIRLVETNPNVADYVAQHWNFKAGPLGDTVNLRVWYMVEDFEVAALFQAGIVLTAGPAAAGGGPAGGLNAPASASFPINASTPVGVWQRAIISVFVPPNHNWAFQAWLFAPQGAVVFDTGASGFFTSPSVSTAQIGGSVGFVADISAIVRMILTHGQDATKGKSTLNISIVAPACGTRMSRDYPYSDHVTVDQALSEFLARGDTFDYSVELGQNTRTFTLYVPRRGTDISGTVALVYGTKPVIGYKATIDGTAVITEDTTLGDNNGPGREEGHYQDNTQIGLTFQSVDATPTGTPLASLDPIAVHTVNLNRAPAPIFEVTIDNSTGLMETPTLGDVIGWACDDGWVQASGLWRVVQITRNCRARTKTLVLNSEPDSVFD